MTYRAAIYLRQSLDRSGEGAAVARQEQECRALAEQQGWTVERVYSDNDRSASSGARPGYAELLANLRAGRHDVVVVWHINRLYRRLRDLVDLVEIAEAQTVRIATVKAGDVDLSTSSGRMVATMLGSVGRHEMERKAERQKAANRQRATKGAASWTRRPFGFDRGGHEVLIREDEASVIRRIADDVLAGTSVAAVCRALDAEGITTTTGGAWSPTTLRRVMTNPRLIGRVIYRGDDMGQLAPAILDEDTFERVAGTLTDPTRRRATSTTTKHLLSGIVTCSTCAEPMYSGRANQHPVYRCLTCHRSRTIAKVDEAIEAVIVARLSQPDAATLLRTEESDVAADRALVVELRERRDSIAALVADGLLGRAAAKEQATRLAQQITEVERRIDAATSGTVAADVADVATADDIEAAWAAAPLPQRRRIIRALLDVEILPAGKGHRFTPEQLEVTGRAAA